MTKAMAQQELNQILGPINIHNEGIPDPTLREYLDKTYFPFKRSRWKGDSTKGSTEQRIETHLRSLMSRRLSTLRREELQTLLNNKASDEGLSFSVVDHLRWDLKSILEMSRNDGIVSGNQAADLFTPVQAKRPEKTYLTAEQVLLGLTVLELRPKLIVSLAILAGMRPGEILALRWPNVHKDHAEIDRRVYKGSVNTPKTNRSVRRAAFPPCVQTDIEAWRALTYDHKKPDAFVFASERDTPLWRDNVWYRMIQPIWSKVGLGWATFQVMRRTWSTLAKDAGVDAKSRAAQMGHGVDVNENEYTQTPLGQLSAATLAVENFINRARPN